jgi:hypothetical protein
MRTGKSTMLNSLLNVKDGFELGGSVDSCTRGIWMWDTPIKHENKHGEFNLIFMDTGGLGSIDRDTELDNKIFVLSLLLSSYFVLNTKNVIGRDVIKHLSIMNDLSNFISINNEVNLNYSINLPDFVWILRDFFLTLKETPKQYLEIKMESLKKHNNNIHEMIKKSFNSIDCICLPIPIKNGLYEMTLEETLQNLNQIDPNHLQKEFRNGIIQFRKTMEENISPKTVSKIPLSGRAFTKFMQIIVKQWNENHSVFVADSLVESIKYAAEKGVHEEIIEYRDFLCKNMVPLNLDVLESKNRENIEVRYKNLLNRLNGSNDLTKPFLDNFLKEIDNIFFIHKNEVSKSILNRQLLENERIFKFEKGETERLLVEKQNQLNKAKAEANNVNEALDNKKARTKMEIEEYNQSIVKAQMEEEKAQEEQKIIQIKLNKSNADAESIALVELETNNSIFELMEKIDQSSRPVSPFILKRFNWKNIRLKFRGNHRDNYKKYLNKITKKDIVFPSGFTLRTNLKNIFNESNCNNVLFKKQDIKCMLKIEPKLKNINSVLVFQIENNNNENVSYCLILKDHNESCIKILNKWRIIFPRSECSNNNRFVFKFENTSYAFYGTINLKNDSINQKLFYGNKEIVSGLNYFVNCEQNSCSNFNFVQKLNEPNDFKFYSEFECPTCGNKIEQSDSLKSILIYRSNLVLVFQENDGVKQVENLLTESNDLIILSNLEIRKNFKIFTIKEAET